MAKVIYERREFTDRQSGIKNEYDYVAIQGTDTRSNGYEVALKNLTQAEKMVLKIIAESETVAGDIVSRKADENETEAFNKKNSQKTILDDDEDDKKKGFFG